MCNKLKEIIMKLHTKLVLALLISFLYFIDAQSLVHNKPDLVLKLNSHEVALKNQLCNLSDMLIPFITESPIIREINQTGSISISLDDHISWCYAKYLHIFVRWLELLKYKKQSIHSAKDHYAKLCNSESILPLLLLSDFFMISELRKKITRKCAYYLNSGNLKFDDIPCHLQSEVATAYFLIFKKIYPTTKDLIRTTLSELAEFNHISKKSKQNTKLRHLFLRNITHIAEYVNHDIITNLMLSHNYLRTLPQEIIKLENLRHLDISFNEFNEFPEHLPLSLRELNLSHNALESIENKQLLMFKKLEKIVLAHNQISSICILAPQNLKTIATQGNPLTYLPIVMYPKNK